MAAGLQNIFVAVTLIVAMFMGCTFNAMNIISEKEDGIDLVNQILPMTHGQYLIQKIMLVFIAVPLLSYLLGANGFISILCYFVPSNAAFEGVMDLAGNTNLTITKDMLILAAHCIICSALYLLISKWQKNCS